MENTFLRLTNRFLTASLFPILGLCLYYIQERHLQYFKINDLPILILGISLLTAATVFNILSGIKYGIMKHMFIPTPRGNLLQSKDKVSFNLTVGLYLLALAGEIALIWYLVADYLGN